MAGLSGPRPMSVDAVVELVHQMPAGILIWDCEGASGPFDMRLAFVNRMAAALLGIDPIAAVGSRLADFAPGLTAEEAATAFELSRTGGVHQRGDLVYRPPGREPIVCRSLIAGLGSGLVATRFEDVTGERNRELERLELLRRLVEIGDEERRQLAMRLHDGMVQHLAAASVLVESSRRHASPGEKRSRLDDAARAVRAAADELRSVQFELSPPELAESDLQSGVRSAVDVVLRGEIKADIDVHIAVEPPDLIRTAAVRVVVEALKNVLCHADASRVSVSVIGTVETLTIEVTDDGTVTRPDRASLGDELRPLVDRVRALGGRCEIRGDGDRGTAVSAQLPLASMGRLTAVRDPRA